MLLGGHSECEEDEGQRTEKHHNVRRKRHRHTTDGDEKEGALGIRDTDVVGGDPIIGNGENRVIANPADTETQSKMRTVRRRIEESSVPLNRIVDQLVDRYSRDLTNLIDRLKNMLKDPENVSDAELEEITIALPVFLYYAAGGLESLGVEGDNAKAYRMEVFNEAYSKVKGTIQDKTREAQLHTFSEYFIEVAFTRAYRKLNTQVKMAEHVFSGIKKVLSKRMLDIEVLHRDTPVRRRPRYDDE